MRQKKVLQAFRKGQIFISAVIPGTAPSLLHWCEIHTDTWEMRVHSFVGCHETNGKDMIFGGPLRSACMVAAWE